MKSCMCTQAQLESEVFQAWGVLLDERPMRMHRKIWEFCFIAQALYERGMLAAGRRGIGFGVGREPLPALFASFGCEITATDYGEDEARAAGWVGTGQYVGSLAMLNERGLCEPEVFKRNVTFRQADMRCLRLDDLGEYDLGEYDFAWSACALEHLGSMAAGEHFILESLRHLRPGGVAVHTTEYDVDSGALLASGPTLMFRDVQSNASWQTVLFGRHDLERVADDVRRMGYRIDLDFTSGNLPCDLVIAQSPYQTEPHLKLNIEGHTATSFGLIIEKGTELGR